MSKAVLQKLSQMQKIKLGYYFDSATDKLYIHASDGLNPDTAGNTILVTKA